MSDKENEKHAAFLAGLRDLCNQHGVVLQERRFTLQGMDGRMDAYMTVTEAPEGKRIASIVIGGWGALEFEMEP